MSQAEGQAEGESVRISTECGVRLLLIAHGRVNALSSNVRAGLFSALECAANESGICAVVITGNGHYFSGGADINEFHAEELPPTLDSIIEFIEASPKPVVAAINGAALGGGLELALACHYRVAADGATAALPEVKLGLIPGLGGTQRLPRIVGLESALDIITSGRSLEISEIAELGLATHLAGEAFLAQATEFAAQCAKDLKASTKLPPRVRDLPIVARGNERGVDVLQVVRERVRRKQRGLAAPLRCVEAVHGATTLSFEDGLTLERRLFSECLASVEAAALTHLFRAERAARTVEGVAADTIGAPITCIGVVGGGTMGRGIVVASLLAGMPTILVERDQVQLDAAVLAIHASLDKLVARGHCTAQRMHSAKKLMSSAVELKPLRHVDLVIEAIYEDLEAKLALFRDLEEVTQRNTILASNTSGLDVDVIAAATERPDRVLGLHFFSPAHVMRLVEIVRGRATSPEVLKGAMRLTQRMDKVPVVARVCEGFIGNRIFDAYWREAEFLVEEGASFEVVDGALVKFGMAMGPFEVSDLAGLDIGHAIRLRQSRRLPNGVRGPGVEEHLYQHGRLGRKNNGGWYDYEPKLGARHAAPVVHELIEDYRRKQGLPVRVPSEDEIITRCISALVNEAAWVLEEGIAERASDIDLVAVHGYGFPAYRGGPMFYAKAIGASTIAAVVKERAAGTHSYWWRPSNTLLKLAADDTRGIADGRTPPTPN